MAERKDGDLELVETRVHLAAAQYHHGLALQKLIPRPPPGPRPASAGARRVAEARELDLASDALSVLLSPWGCCCSGAPPGIITTTLQELAEMLRIAATRRERRRTLVLASREKFLPRPESVDRLHAGLIGRSLGRSFANVLLLTKVLMGFRQALHQSQLSERLASRTQWLQREKSLPDLRALEWHFDMWRELTVHSGQRQAAEAEIVRGRASLVEVFTQGRDALGRAVDSLQARHLEFHLLLLLCAWREALRLSSLEAYGLRLAQTPRRVEKLFLAKADEACLLLSLICWAACCGLLRQGRELEEADVAAWALERQLSREASRGARWLLVGLWRHWRQLRQAGGQRRRGLRRLEARARTGRMRGVWQAWWRLQSRLRGRRRGFTRGEGLVREAQRQQRRLVFGAWVELLHERKALALSEGRAHRRRRFIDRRFQECCLQQLRCFLAAWCHAACEGRQALRRAADRARSLSERLALRCFWAWLLYLKDLRHELRLRQLEVTKEEELNRALHSAVLALKRCQEQCGPFHCHLLSAWRGLVRRRRQRLRSECWVLKRQHSWQEHALSSCLRTWRQAAEERRGAHRLRAKLLSAWQWQEASQAQQACFQAWKQLRWQNRMQELEKERLKSKIMGQMMLDAENLRSGVFHAWRNLLQHLRHDALQRAAEVEAAELRRQAQERHLQVLREAFLSSAEALVASAVRCWRSAARGTRQGREAQRARELRGWEEMRFLLAHSFTSWRFQTSRGRCRVLRRRHAERCQEVLQKWRLRGYRGLILVEDPFCQVLLLELWRHTANEQASRRGELSKGVQPSPLPRLILLLWRQESTTSCKQRSFRDRAADRQGMLQHLSSMRQVLCSWSELTQAQRCERRVAASCQNAREVQLHVRDRMLYALERLLRQSELPVWHVLLLRWRSYARAQRLKGHAKECAFIAATRSMERRCLEWFHVAFSEWKSEALQMRQQQLSERLERQVSGARVVQQEMTNGWRKACGALGRQQLLELQRLQRVALRGWYGRRRAESGDALWRRRFSRLVWHWRLLILQEKWCARLQRSRRRAQGLLSNLREAWLLQQTLRGWQHARAYEELFRLLSDTQDELAKAAEATALAETVALAQQRSQQVTVHLSPRAAPSSLLVRTLEDSTSFRAPIVSLQKDIQRHYAQRLEDLRPSPKPCCFEVNFERGEDFKPKTREAWRSP